MIQGYAWFLCILACAACKSMLVFWLIQTIGMRTPRLQKTGMMIWVHHRLNLTKMLELFSSLPIQLIEIVCLHLFFIMLSGIFMWVECYKLILMCLKLTYERKFIGVINITGTDNMLSQMWFCVKPFKFVIKEKEDPYHRLDHCLAFLAADQLVTDCANTKE